MKKPCLAPFHPFKQTWFEWHEGDHPNYCPSCIFFWQFTLNIVRVLLEPRETLYGSATITMSREDAHSAVDQVYDELEKTP